MRLPANATTRELLPLFCEHWERSSVAAWALVRAAHDVDGLLRLGHSVKGSFAQFELFDGAEHGEGLMACGRRGDWAGAEAHLRAIDGVIAEARRALAEGE